MADFDNIENESNGKNVDSDKNAKNDASGGLQNVIKAISCLPCFPKYTPKPDTPNIDKLKDILNKFKSEDPNEIQTTIVDRKTSDDLADWTQKVSLNCTELVKEIRKC